MQYNLDGKTAFVTGGASGIGRACAELLARERANVVIADIDMVQAKQTVDRLTAQGGSAIAVHADVCEASSVEEAVARAVQEFGSLHCAVNSAGLTLAGERRLTADVEVDTFDRLIAVDLRGVFLSMKFQLPQMLRHGGGSIVNVSSGSGLRATKFNPGYVAAKHGLLGLTKAVALEYAESGIRVNAVCPGLTATPMTSLIMEEHLSSAVARIPLGRWASAEEIAQGIVWLLSDASSYTTAAILAVDGGYTAS